jgi:putative ABC transport system permease protein
MTGSLGKKLIRDLLRAKASFGAAILVVLLGVTLLGTSYASYKNLLRSYEHSYDVLHFADFVSGMRDAGDDLPELVTGLPGIARAEARLVGELPAVTPDGESGGVVARIISVPAPAEPAVNNVLVYEGEYLTGAPGEVLLESSFAEFHDVDPGDTLRVISRGEPVDLVVRGLVRTAEYILPAKSKQDFLPQPKIFAIVYADHATAVELLGLPDPYNDVAVVIESGADREAVIDALAERVAPAMVTGTTVREDQASNAALKMDLEGFREMALAFPILFFAAAAITLAILLGRMVRAQMPVVGLMRAVGYGPRAVLWHYTAFGLAIGLVGAVAGSVLGFLLGGVVTRFYVQIINVPVVKIEPEWTSLAVGLVAAVLVCAAAALLPAWRASRIQPADAMRGEIGIAGSGGTRIGAGWPPALRIAVRNILRNRLRSFYTAVGIALAAVVVVISVAYLDTMNSMIDQEFEVAMPHDATVYFGTPVDAGIVAEIREIPGVAEVEPFVQVPVEIRVNGERYSTLLVGLPADARLWNLFDAQQNRVTPDAGLRLAMGLRERLRVEVGDEIEVAAFGYIERMEIAGFVEQMMGSNAYLSLEALQDHIGLGAGVTGVMALAEPGRDHEMVRELEKLPDVAYTSTAFGIREMLDEFMGLFYGIIGMMVAFAALLAFTVVFNTVTVSVMERRRELATMRMIGAGMGRVAAIVTLENLGIGILGIAGGLLVGRLLSDPAVMLFNSDAFSFNRAVVEPLTVAVLAVVLLIVVLASAVPGIRYVSRMELADVARERAT